MYEFNERSFQACLIAKVFIYEIWLEVYWKESQNVWAKILQMFSEKLRLVKISHKDYLEWLQTLKGV